MIDPLSIAGLAIGVFDQLIKLGERTAQLVSDSKSFGDDSENLFNKINDENNRTLQLRNVLFEPSPVYGGLTLFENFDEDVQDQIRIFLNRLSSILQEAYNLLCSRYGQSEYLSSASHVPSKSMSELSISSACSSSATTLRSPSPRSPWRMFPKQSISMLRWSFQDKKRTEEVLKDYMDLNSRIHENIKLWCLASSIGLNQQHLRRLQTDVSSKQLGFDIDATLKLTMRDAAEDTSTFELAEPLWLEELRRAVPVETRFGLLKHNGKTYLQEHRHCDPSHDSPGNIDQRTSQRVNDLVKLLHQPKEKVFCIPRCIGWKYLASRQNIAFVFELPDGAIPEPVSLYRLLDNKDVKLSLGERFKLALALASCISQLQMVKWVHESFRSENILFFPEKSSDCDSARGNITCGIDFAKPQVLGFESSRPELDFSAGFADICIERDVYRHPDRQGRPAQVFNKIHDIYALGVVLLEIGLWQRAITLERNNFRTARDPHVIQAQLMKQAQRRLGDKMGAKYQKIVTTCLSAEFGVKDDTKEDLKLQQAFRLQIVDVLERAAYCL